MKKLFLSIFAVALLLSCESESKMSVTVENSAAFDRSKESVEVSIDKINAKFGAESIVAVFENGVEIPSQKVEGALLFQATVAANSSANYEIKAVEAATEYPIEAYGRLVPERYDDWAWENNRIAFRVYGPALEATGEISNAIDIWLKRTDKMVINRWYVKGINYHIDHGEGLDCYKAGRTLGAGAFAPISKEGNLVLGHNFVKAEAIDNGPIRTSMKLTYAPYSVDGVMVNETRIISLDANSQFNKITSNFDGDFTTLPAGAAIVLREEEGGVVKSLANGVAYSEPVSKANGTTHVAVLLPSKCEVKEIDNHVVATTTISKNRPITYLQGAGWDKFGFATAADWQKAVTRQAEIVASPLKVTVK